MSRPIKFRAWTHQNPPMQWFSKNVAITGNGEQMTPIGGTFTGIWHTLGDRDEGLIIEQYTGLTDKNGKEIYEGDIVRYSFINPNRTYTEPVSFGPIQDGEGYFHQEFLAWRTTYADDGTAHSSLLDLVEPNWTCEVIGNVHENPELLGGEE